MVVSGFHFRSISLPSRVQPLNASKIQSQLQKLKSFQVSNTTSQAIQCDLQVLAEMYNSVEEAAKSSATQQRESMEESLECSVELLDSCDTIRELVLTIKENVQALQSALRRKGLDYSNVQYDVITYACFRKRTSKIIAKILKTLDNLENKNGSQRSVEESSNESFVRVFREVACLTVAIFKSLLLFLTWPTANPGARAWSLISRLVLPKSTANVISEVGNVDFEVRTFEGRRRKNDATVIDVQNLQRNLQNVNIRIEEFEGGLERLFRLLVRCRVTVLNILTHQLK